MARNDLWNAETRPFVVPFLVWNLLLIPQSLQPDAVLWSYPLRTVAVATLLLYYSKAYEIRFQATGTAILAGILVAIFWIGLDPFVAGAAARKPGWTPEFLRDSAPGFFWTWVAFRCIGSAVVIAAAEEIFWRGFLLRWIIRPDFKAIALGTFSGSSLLWTTALFGVEHGERWVSGILAGLVYAGLLYWRRSLGACILAHGLTNFLLSLYVIKTGAWHFW